MRRFFAASPVIAGILIFASQAQAQQGPTPAAAAALGAPMIGEVLVTAQRRSERAIDVPQTVNLVSGERLEKSGITDTMSLGQVVPSFYIAPNGLTVQPTIRGVGSSVTTPGASGTVAAYIDGVYQLAQGTYDFDLTDLEKIEVLKGPQGTLYGRNATGGVVLITTKPPSFKPGGHITVGYGNYNAYSANIYATGPIAPKLAGNFSADYKASDGYFQDIFRNTRVGDKERYAVGGKLLYEINDDAKIVVGLKHSFNSDPNSFASAPLNGNTVARRTPGTIIASKPYDVALTFTPSIKNQYDQASLAADFGNDKVHFSLISGANFNTEKIYADPDFSPLPTTFAYQVVHEKVLSQEITASSVGEGRFSWIGGLMYVRTEGEYDPYISVLTAIINTSTTNDSYSGFGEFTYRFTDRLKVVAGARYTKENLDYSGARNGIAVAQASQSTSKWTPRVSVNYKLTNDTNLYATYSEGFRSGGWNASILSNVGYQPEFVKAYEIGAKGSIARRLNISAALYKYDFTNIQFSAAVITSTGASSTTILNAAAGEIYGAEAGGDFTVNEHLVLQAGIGYTHAEYKSFPNALVTQPTGLGGNTQFVANASGKTMVRTPDLTANIGGTYTTDLAGGELQLSGNANYVSSLFRDAGNRIKDPPHTIVNGRAAFTPGGKPYEFSLWAKNLTDERYAAYTVDSTAGDRINYAPPRTFGASVTLNF